MRPNLVIAMNTLDASKDETGITIDLTFSQVIGGTIVVTGTSTGTAQLQVSCDQPSSLPVDSTGKQIPVNWVNLGSSISISGAGTYLIPVTQVSYKWLRLIFTHGDAAAGTVLANIFCEGQ